MKRPVYIYIYIYMLVNLQFQTEICLIYYALSTLIEKEKLRLFSKRLVVSWTQELAKINAVPCCTVISNTQNLRTNCTGRKACFILHVCRNKCSLQWIFSLFRSRYDQKCIYHIKRTIKLCDLNLHVNDSQVLVKVFNLNFIENYFNVSYAFLSSLSLSLSLSHTHTHTHIHCYHQHHYHREGLTMDVEILHMYKLGFSHISSNIVIIIIIIITIMFIVVVLYPVFYILYIYIYEIHL